MLRTIFCLSFALLPVILYAQKVVSMGIFTGMTVPFTLDKGIDTDPRYQVRYDIKPAPIGLHFGMDSKDAGFMISPSLLTIGQNFNVINTVGGKVGIRKNSLQYVHLPISFKVALMKVHFFTLGFTGSIGAAYLLKGKETITHEAATIKFPKETYGILPLDYTILGNGGVQSPAVSGLVMVNQTAYQPFQVTGALGFRADWDVTKVWRASLDLRGNYTFLDSRNKNYLDSLLAFQRLYDRYGNRRDFFVLFTLGISKTMTFKKKGSNKKRKSGPSHKRRH